MTYTRLTNWTGHRGSGKILGCRLAAGHKRCAQVGGGGAHSMTQPRREIASIVLARHDPRRPIFGSPLARIDNLEKEDRTRYCVRYTRPAAVLFVFRKRARSFTLLSVAESTEDEPRRMKYRRPHKLYNQHAYLSLIGIPPRPLLFNPPQRMGRLQKLRTAREKELVFLFAYHSFAYRIVEQKLPFRGRNEISSQTPRFSRSS